MFSEAVIYKKKDQPLIIDEIEIPDPSSEQVVVAIYASGLCHSLLINLNRDPSMPELLGHEATGIIIKLGKSVKHVKEGDEVIITSLPYEANKNTQYAKWSTIKWRNKELKGINFTLSKHSIMHSQFVSKLDPRVDKYKTAILGCAGIAGYGTVQNLVNIQKDESVAIYGIGALGSLATNAAKNLGSNPIIAVDISEEKLKFSTEFGSTHKINAKVSDPVESIRDITDGAGCDYVFDMVGSELTQNQAILSSREGVSGFSEGGTTVFVGFPIKQYEFASRHIIMGQRKIIGSRLGNTIVKKDFPKFYDELVSGKFLLNKAVTSIFNFEESSKAINLLKNGEILGRAIVKM